MSAAGTTGVGARVALVEAHLLGGDQLSTAAMQAGMDLGKLAGVMDEFVWLGKS